MLAYENALKIGSTGSIIQRLHHAQSSAGDTQKADERVLQWVKANPQDAATRQYLAGEYARRGRADLAIPQYEAVIERQPQNVVALNNLALIYLNQKNVRGLELAQSAYNLRSESPGVIDTYGWGLVQFGNAPRGLELIQKAAKLAPTNAEIRLHLAAALDPDRQERRGARRVAAVAGQGERTATAAERRGAAEESPVGAGARIRSAQAMPLIRIEGVGKDYRLGQETVKALRHVTFDIEEGVFLAIAGPSGSGKTTLLNLIGCIDTPSEAAISIDGVDVAGKTSDELADLRGRTIGFIFQSSTCCRCSRRRRTSSTRCCR